MLEPKFEVTSAVLDDAWNAADGQEREPGEGEIGFVIRWQTAGAGYGETSFYMGPDNCLHCDDETMGREFVVSVLLKFLESCKLDHPRRE